MSVDDAAALPARPLGQKLDRIIGELIWTAMLMPRNDPTGTSRYFDPAKALASSSVVAASEHKTYPVLSVTI